MHVVYLLILTRLCCYHFSERLVPSSKDPAQSTSSSFYQSPTTKMDYGGTDSSSQYSKVADVEDVIKQSLIEGGKTSSSATVISKATVDSSLTICSATSCSIIPGPRTHPTDELSHCHGLTDEATYQRSTQYEHLKVHSALICNTQEQLFPAQTPTMSAHYARKQLFQNEILNVKSIAGKDNLTLNFSSGEIDASEMGAEWNVKNCVSAHDETGGDQTDIACCEDTQSIKDSKLRNEHPSQNAEITGKSVGVELDDSMMIIEQDSLNSDTFAEEVTPEFCPVFSAKSFDFDYITQADADTTCHSDACTNSDVASQGSAPLTTQDTMSSDREEDSTDDETMLASPSMKAWSIRARKKQKTMKAMDEVNAKITSRTLETHVLESCDGQPTLRRTTSNIMIHKVDVNESITSPEVTMRISSPIDDLSKSDITNPEEIRITSARLCPSRIVDINRNLDLQSWKEKVRKEVKSNDEWRCVMNILKYHGLSFQKGSGLVSFYFKFPNGKYPRDGGVAGVDFLENEDDVKDLAVRELGWNGGFEYARLIEKVAKRLSSRPSATASTLQATSPSGQADFKLSRKMQMTSPMDKAEKRISNHQNESTGEERVSAPERKQSLKEKLLCCQKALQESFVVAKMTSSGKIQKQLDVIDSFLNSIVDSNAATGAATGPGESILYIAGAPGVGKTSAVKFACRSFENAHKNVTFCNISASLAQSRTSIMGRLANSMFLASNTPESKIQDSLQTGCTRRNERRLVIMVIDEIDYLLSDQEKGKKKARNESEETLVTLMEWATNKNLSFALIGISNVVGGRKANRIKDLGMVRNTAMQ